VACGAVYSRVVPLGEAPDEPAHLGYVEHLLRTGRPPPAPHLPTHRNYEAHQPPLDYALTALAYRSLGGAAGQVELHPRPEFRPGVRASRNVEVAGAPRARERLRWLRLLRLVLWGGGAAAGTLWLVCRAVGTSPVTLAACFPIVLAPQFLFTAATLNNDASVACLATLALAALVASLGAPAPARAAAAGSCLAGLALFAKASAWSLAVPLLAMAAVHGRRGRRPAAAATAVPFVLAAAAWLALSWWRFGTLWPPAPTGVRPLELARLVAEPRWAATLWVSFWARFGWFNLPLPAAAYLLFLPATALAAWGALAALRSRHRPGSATLMVPLLLLAANLALLLGYMVRVDWQPQGRLLFPGLGAVAALAAHGAERWVAGRPRRAAALVAGLPALALAAAALGAWWIAVHYG
jgi:hypothetical protein